MILTNEDLLQMYRYMVLIRQVEEKSQELIWSGKPLVGGFHLSVGQEAIAVGTCYGLRRDDWVLPYLRGRGMFIVRGQPVKDIIAGWYGKANGVGHGRWSHHHIGDDALGLLAGSGVVGADIPIAAGAALAIKLKGTDQVVLSFFGDGCANTGNWHEGVNFAGVQKLPVVFICENNFYSVTTPMRRATAAKHIADRAQGYGIPGVVVDGNDVVAVFQATQTAIERARAGEGPTLIECETYRWYAHNPKFPDSRPTEEIETWKLKCPIRRLERELMEKGLITPEMCSDILREVRKEVEEAVAYAEASPDPDPQQVYEDLKLVYAGSEEE